MLAWERVLRFVCNSSIQAAFFSTTFFAYVLIAIMTHFSDRLFATQPYLNDIKGILAHNIVRSDVFIDLNVYFINLHINELSLVLELPQCKVLIWSLVALLNSFCILTMHMIRLIGRVIVGSFNGYQYCCISTRASTSIHNDIDKSMSPLCSRSVFFPDRSTWTTLLGP